MMCAFGFFSKTITTLPNSPLSLSEVCSRLENEIDIMQDEIIGMWDRSIEIRCWHMH